MNKASRTILESRARGTRRINGTDWPVDDFLMRDQRAGQLPTWQIMEGLCNGAWSRLREFKRRKDAVCAWGEM